MRRVTERLKLAAQTCRNTDVRMLIENAGSFARSTELLDLIARVDSQWLGASYSVMAAVNAGECPIDGVQRLGDRLKMIRVSDVDDDGNHVLLGRGRLPLNKLINALGKSGYAGWIVYEYPKHWQPKLPGTSDEVLGHACETLYSWVRESQPATV